MILKEIRFLKSNSKLKKGFTFFITPTSDPQKDLNYDFAFELKIRILNHINDNSPN